MTDQYFPRAMLDERRWLVRRRFANSDNKQPCSPLKEKPAGYVPRQNEKETSWRWRWQQRCVQVAFNDAVRYLKENRDQCDGLSFVVHPGGDVEYKPRIICIDFDDAFDRGGNTHPHIQTIIDVADSFVERSRSGNGLHLFVIVPCVPFTNLTHTELEGGGSIEVLCNAQVAVTGNVYGEPSEIATVPFSFLESLPGFVAREASSTTTDKDFGADWWGNSPAALIDDAVADEMKTWEAAIRDQSDPCDSHKVLYSAACRLARYGIDGWEAVELLRLCPVDTAWTDAELKHKVEEAYVATTNDGTYGTLPIASNDGSEFTIIVTRSNGEENNGSEFTINPTEIDKVQVGNGLPRVMSTKFLLSYKNLDKFIINKVLVENQPAVIGGSKKTLKTSIGADLAIAITTGKKFLGYFDVLETKNVLVVSGESGITALQNVCKRILESHGLKGLEDAPKLFWSTYLPILGDKKSMRALVNDLAGCKAKVLILDPLYLCMSQKSADSAGNLFAMGPLFRSVGEYCSRLGVTPILLHHEKKNGSGDFDLNNLTQAGIAEYVRQWVGLCRRGPFVGGHSELRMNVGGSMGHSGVYRVVVDEGVLDPALGIERTWKVDVSPSDPEEEIRDVEECEAVVDALEKGPLTMNKLREDTRMYGPKIKRLLDTLINDGVVEIDKSGKYDTYQLCKDED